MSAPDTSNTGEVSTGYGNRTLGKPEYWTSVPHARSVLNSTTLHQYRTWHMERVGRYLIDDQLCGGESERTLAPTPCQYRTTRSGRVGRYRSSPVCRRCWEQHAVGQYRTSHSERVANWHHLLCNLKV
eukprot:337932-Rhodomonas_salina.2